MKLAAIDLGTNTFHLIIAEQNGPELQILFKTNEPVKLGEDITKNNLIIPAAFERGVACLKNFANLMLEHDVTEVKAVATSGVRSASNGIDFIDAVKNETGIAIEVIDGDLEAEYIYEGVKWSGAITDRSLIMDIGGGSTEFMLCDEEGLIWKKSYDIGAARLMQRFFKSDPINVADQQSILDYLADELKALFIICKEFKPQVLIGSAGAFETYAQMINPANELPTTATTNIDYQSFLKLADQLLKSNHEERKNMRGLIPLRVDMIVMASLLTRFVLKKTGIEQIILSTYDLKMGVLQSLKN